MTNYDASGGAVHYMNNGLWLRFFGHRICPPPLTRVLCPRSRGGTRPAWSAPRLNFWEGHRSMAHGLFAGLQIRRSPFALPKWRPKV